MTELEKIEQRIEMALKTCRNASVAVYKELAVVAELKLWEGKYPSFLGYCETRWKTSRQRGYQITDYIEILNGLPEKCQQLLTHESQGRALKRVAPEERERVIEKAKSAGKVTAKSIKEAAKPEVDRDKTKYPIPKEVLVDWRKAEEVGQELASHISEVRVSVKRGFDSDDVIFREVTRSIMADLNNAYTSLKGIIPFAVCTTCQGIGRTRCNLCKGRGFLSQFGYEHWVPQETRKMREAK